METVSFLKGMLIGFSIAASVGPIGILCIRRSLYSGPWMGLCAGMGAATADAVYGFVAAFSLTSVSTFLLHYRVWISSIGGVFLCYLGIRTFLSAPPEKAAAAVGNRAMKIYSSTFLLTLANPATILSFVADSG